MDEEAVRDGDVREQQQQSQQQQQQQQHEQQPELEAHEEEEEQQEQEEDDHVANALAAFEDAIRAADELLYEASLSGNLHGMQDALDAGAAPDSAQGDRAFVCACRRGDVATVQFLLDIGASPIADTEKEGLSALEAACKGGHIMIVKMLLDAGSLQLWTDDCALVFASSRGDYDIVELLLAGGMQANNHHDWAILAACANGHPDVVALLLASGADPSAQHGRPLALAASSGQLAVMEMLLEAGADVNIHNDVALRDVCNERRDQPSVVKRLLEAGANVHVNDDEPLREVCSMGAIETAKCLLEAGADVHARNGEPLIRASRGGFSNLVEVLMGAGASVRAVVKTALAAAMNEPSVQPEIFYPEPTRLGRIEVLAILVGTGVDTASLRLDLRLFTLQEQLHVMFAVRPSQFRALDQDLQVQWLRYVLRPRRRLLDALFRARARLDRPPTHPLGTTKPSREELIAQLKTAGRRFARDYWADGIPLFFPGLDLGPVPSEFLHVSRLGAQDRR